jgi:ABC-type antimicrobial peptide transport system permease subunit
LLRWKKHGNNSIPDFHSNIFFTDDEIAKTYKAENTVSKLSRYFAFLAIFISCLGLFGLVTFTAEQRTKEIGIRKVLGASVTGIIQMLSTDFLKLVLLASLIAFPIAWWAMDNWLADYAYKVDIGWWIFPIAGNHSYADCTFNGKFSGNQSCICKPGNCLKK